LLADIPVAFFALLPLLIVECKMEDIKLFSSPKLYSLMPAVFECD